MSTPNYAQNTHPAENLKELLRAQNEAGITKAVFKGLEPIEVLVAKAVTNANHAAVASGSVPAGGSTGQALVKASNIDLDVIWANQTGGTSVPSGGTTGQVLTKVSNADGDADWTTVGGTGDVTAASNFGTDNRLLRSDGVLKGAQSSSVSLDDSGNITNVATITATTVSASGVAIGAGGVSLNAALSTDDTYAGLTISGINGGETIAQWEVVYYSFSDTEWMKADANAAGKFPAAGIAVAATTNGNAATVLVSGTVRNDAWTWVAGPIYLSTTAGGLTQTAPSASGDCVQPVGYAITADVAFFHFNQAYAEVA